MFRLVLPLKEMLQYEQDSYLFSDVADKISVCMKDRNITFPKHMKPFNLNFGTLVQISFPSPQRELV